MAPESERACTKCGHPRNAHDMEQPYQCFHIPDGAFEYSCDCDGFSHAPEPTLTCSDCGHPKDDSRYHLDAPGTNWGAALHWYVAPAPCPLNESNRTQFESGCSEVVERLPMSAKEFKDEYEWTEPHDVTYHAPRAAYSHDELIEFAEAYAKRCLHSWRERDERKNLAMLLDRMGGDSVVAYQEGETADQFRDAIYEHFVWWGERNREEERLNNDKK